MALFKRNKKESVMPEEVQNFYAAERRQRKGTAWLLAIATLLITFLIASLLFFGGRWVYRAIFDNDDKATTSQEEAAQEQKTEESKSTSDSTESPSSAPADSSTPQSTPNPDAASGSSPSTSTQTVPAAGPSELVNTGPGDE